MHRKTLIALLTLAALLILAVSLTNLSKQLGGDVNQLLVPALEAQLNDVASVRVVGAGDQAIATLSRAESAWELAEKSGYRADIGRIRSNLIALARARIIEQKTANPEYFERLGVETIAGESASGVLIELDGLAEPVSIIIGDTGIGGDYAYVREAGENQSWLVNGVFDLPTETIDWVDREMLDIPTARIRAVTITHPDGEVLRIEKATAADPNFVVPEIPDGRELNYPSVANAMAGVLTGLSLEDVQASPDLESAEAAPATIMFETFDGLLIDVTAYSLNDGTWIQVAARLDERPTPIASADTDDAPDQTAPEGSAIGDEVERLNARLGGWAYTVASYKTEQLLKRIDDLLAPANDELPLPEKSE